MPAQILHMHVYGKPIRRRIHPVKLSLSPLASSKTRPYASSPYPSPRAAPPSLIHRDDLVNAVSATIFLQEGRHRKENRTSKTSQRGSGSDEEKSFGSQSKTLTFSHEIAFISGKSAVLQLTEVDMRVDRTLPWRDDHIPRDLVLGDALFDFGHELRRAALDHLPDFRPELMEEVDPRIAANRRTKSLERRRSGSLPIWAVSRGDSGRSQHSEEIRRVQGPLSGVPTRD